jgi:hypothetical protein
LHQLKVHERVRLCDETPFECSKCKQNNFETRLDYLKHLILCYYPNAYTCKTCNHSFENYMQFIFHLKYIHTPVVYMCAICTRKYRNIKDLLDHDQLIHSKSINYCELCYEPHKSRSSLLEHYRNSHLTCHNNEGANETKLTKVSLIEPKDVEKSLSVLIDTNLVNKHSDTDPLNDHIVITNNETSSISVSETSQNHSIQLKNSDINPTRLVYESSSNEFLFEDSNAQKQDEANEDPDNEDSSSSDWTKVHKNELIRGLIDRKHQCKWCSLRFYSKSQLKQHELTHSNSLLYCPVCDKEFTHKDRLSGHMKCHMEPSLECKVCGKKFKRLCNLYNHELVHGLTEHAFMLCQFCGRGFRSRRDYQNHVIANHRDLLLKSDPNSTVNTNINTNNSTSNLMLPVIDCSNDAQKSNSNKKIATKRAYNRKNNQTNKHQQENNSDGNSVDVHFELNNQ